MEQSLPAHHRHWTTQNRASASTGAQSDLMDSTRWGGGVCSNFKKQTPEKTRLPQPGQLSFYLRRAKTENFEVRGSSQASSAVHEAKKRRAKQVITCSFPCGKWLHMIGARASPGCDLCTKGEKHGPENDRRPPNRKQWRTFKVPVVKRSKRV